MQGPMEVIKQLTRGPSGRTSSTRSFMWFFAGAMSALWFVILVGIFLDQTGIMDTGLGWDPFQGPMNWARDFVFLSFLPFLISEAAGAYAVKRDSSPQIAMGDVEVQVQEKASGE